MTLTERIKAFLKDNTWVLIAVFFFIAWKFFLISTLWEDRAIPPIPSDSSVYLLHIDATLNCSNLLSCPERAISLNTYTGIDHLGYRLLLGILGKIFRLDTSATYEMGFYTGTVLLAATLALFLSKLAGSDKKLAAFLIIILGLYNGSGSYHGFFWVVPSFFSLLLFILILNSVLNTEIRHWKAWLALLVPLSIFTHMLGLYMLLILPIYFVLYAFLRKSVDRLILKKIAYTVVIGAIVYIPVSMYFTLHSYGNPYGPEVFVTKILGQVEYSTTSNESGSPGQSQLISTTLIDLPGWKNIYTDYFRWIFPSWIGYLAFFTCIALHFYFKQYEVLCLYLAGLLFTLLSSVNLHGERSLIFLWPMTYLLYGHSSWLAIKFIDTKMRPSMIAVTLKSAIILITLFFAILSLSYSYYWNIYLNNLANIPVSRELKDFLIQNTRPDEKVFYSAEADFIDNFLMLERGRNRPTKALSSEEARWSVEIDNSLSTRDSLFYTYVFDRFFRVISTTLRFEKKPDNLIVHTDTDSMKKNPETISFGPIFIRSNQ